MTQTEKLLQTLHGCIVNAKGRFRSAFSEKHTAFSSSALNNTVNDKNSSSLLFEVVPIHSTGRKND